MWWKPIAVSIGICATLLSGYRSRSEPVEPNGSVNANVVVIGIGAEDGAGSDVLMLVDEAPNDRKPDGEVDRVFRLQTESAAMSQLGLQFTDVEVAWTRSKVDVMTGGAGVLTLTLTGEGTSGMGRQLHGFGLGHSTQWGVSLPPGNLTAIDYRNLRTTFLSLLEECDCRSGGGGATSCSVGGCEAPPTSCSVSCGGGSDPCCGCGALSGRACCGCVGAT